MYLLMQWLLIVPVMLLVIRCTLPVEIFDMSRHMDGKPECSVIHPGASPSPLMATS